MHTQSDINTHNARAYFGLPFPKFHCRASIAQEQEQDQNHAFHDLVLVVLVVLGPTRLGRKKVLMTKRLEYKKKGTAFGLEELTWLTTEKSTTAFGLQGLTYN